MYLGKHNSEKIEVVNRGISSSVKDQIDELIF